MCEYMQISENEFYSLSVGSCKKYIKDYLSKKQQDKWNSYPKARFFKKCKPNVGKNKLWNKGCREGSTLLCQLRSGFNYLNKTQSLYNQLSDNLCEKCVVEDVNHFIFNCEKYSQHRDNLKQ